jgi:hypothetical protein
MEGEQQKLREPRIAPLAEDLIPPRPREALSRSLSGAMAEEALLTVEPQRWGIALGATVLALENRMERAFRGLLQGRVDLSTAQA